MAARLPCLTRDQLAEADREVWDNFVKSRGVEPGHIHRTIAHAPNLLGRFVALADELRNATELDPRLRELALMTVGRLTGAEYEFVHHWNIALRVGVRREQLDQLAGYATSPAFNPAERAVIRYAEEATRNVRVSAVTFDALRGFLDHRRIVELVMNVALYNAVARVVVPCEVALEEGVTTR